MPRTTYTVVAVLREEALCTPTETTFRVTVSDGTGPCGIVLMAQPRERRCRSWRVRFCRLIRAW